MSFLSEVAVLCCWSTFMVHIILSCHHDESLPNVQPIYSVYMIYSVQSADLPAGWFVNETSNLKIILQYCSLSVQHNAVLSHTLLLLKVMDSADVSRTQCNVRISDCCQQGSRLCHQPTFSIIISRMDGTLVLTILRSWSSHPLILCLLGWTC